MNRMEPLTMPTWIRILQRQTSDSTFTPPRPSKLRTADGSLCMDVPHGRGTGGSLFQRRTPHTLPDTPRELKIRNGKLIQTPVKELEQLKGDEIPFIRDGEHTVRLLPGDRTWFLHFTLTEPEQKVSARFHSGESSLAWDPETKLIRFTRKNWVTGKNESRECRIDCLREVEIWSDQSSMEIFLNGGEAVMSSRIFPEAAASEVVIKGLSDNEEIQMNEINGGKNDVIL